MSSERETPGRPRELYRELCRDEDGNRYIVIVWRSYPGLPITYYTLDDGTPVHFDDGRIYTIVPTGEQLTQCEDELRISAAPPGTVRRG